MRAQSAIAGMSRRLLTRTEAAEYGRCTGSVFERAWFVTPIAFVATVLDAREPETPTDRPAIDWRLITDLAVNSPEQAVEKLDWYACRCKIEVFHHILKTGCRAEHARLRTAERLVKLPASQSQCTASWRGGCSGRS